MFQGFRAVGLKGSRVRGFSELGRPTFNTESFSEARGFLYDLSVHLYKNV